MDSEIMFGENLKKLRMLNSYSRTQLGEKLSYSSKAIEKWEAGVSTPPLVVISEISKLFGVSLEKLIYDDNEGVKYFLGIDGGGTKTAFLLTDISGRTVAECSLGASNPCDIGIEECKRVLSVGINTVCHEINRSEISVFAGVSGITSDENRQNIKEFLKGQNFYFSDVGNDIENVLELTLKGKNGERYVPVSERTGEKSQVFFTSDLSAKGLLKIYEKLSENIDGKVAIKLHTGEKNGPNIIPRDWVKELVEKDVKNGVIVETNTYYEGDRYTTEDHRETLKVNGWDFCEVDILDSEGTAMLPVKGGKWFGEMSVGSHLKNYDSLITLTHFKGHVMGGFGGSNKNLGIGCADGRTGKKMIHSSPAGDWGVTHEELMEKISESTKSVVDYFGGKVIYINVLRNMSVSCDCEGVAAKPVVTPNIGIIGSTDILSVDTASVDLVYALKQEDNHDLVKRIESRHGHRQLSYMKELKMGNDLYDLIDVDKNSTITLFEAVKDVVPFK